MSQGPKILVNSRVLMLKSNGQKRVAEELILRIPTLTPVRPSAGQVSGLSGHMWEQLALPLQARGIPLWSPSTSGPVMYRNHIVTMHDVAFIDIPQYFSRSFARWYTTMTALLSRSARHIITVSEFTRQRAIEVFKLDSNKVSTIHLGIASSFHQYSSPEVADILSRFNLSDRSYIVGFLGTDPRKNTTKLLEAWNLSGAARTGAKLALFGRPANNSVFAKSTLPENTEGVITLGAIDDRTLACLYSASLGFVFPSFYEGFGLPIVEAANCGCRIVTSNISSLPEVSPSDTIFVDPSSKGAIAEAIRYLVNTSDNEELRDRRIREMRRFNWDMAATQYSQLFHQVFNV